MKNHCHDYYRTSKTEHKTSKIWNFNKQNKSGEKDEKATEEESQACFTQINKYIEATWYFYGNPGHIFPGFSKAASTPKDKWLFKTETQHLCAES